MQKWWINLDLFNYFLFGANTLSNVLVKGTLFKKLVFYLLSKIKNRNDETMVMCKWAISDQLFLVVHKHYIAIWFYFI